MRILKLTSIFYLCDKLGVRRRLLLWEEFTPEISTCLSLKMLVDLKISKERIYLKVKMRGKDGERNKSRTCESG